MYFRYQIRTVHPGGTAYGNNLDKPLHCKFASVVSRSTRLYNITQENPESFDVWDPVVSVKELNFRHWECIRSD
jgi:hypothetical protein